MRKKEKMPNFWRVFLWCFFVGHKRQDGISPYPPKKLLKKGGVGINELMPPPPKLEVGQTISFGPPIHRPVKVQGAIGSGVIERVNCTRCGLADRYLAQMPNQWLAYPYVGPWCVLWNMKRVVKAWVRFAWWHLQHPGKCPHCDNKGYTFEDPYGKVICGMCSD